MRGLLLAPALIGVLWAAAALPPFLRIAPIAAAAARILADDRFAPGALTDIWTVVEARSATALPHPDLTRATALVLLRLAEEAMARKSSEGADRAVSTAREALTSALAVNPRDSFLWLMLYSVETSRNGFDLRDIRYLNQSYATGPYEGWISLRRNRLALAAFPMLSDATRSAVLSEFAEMVDANFIEDTAGNLVSTGWPYRDLLLAALDAVDIAEKQSLARLLRRQGVKLSIPGIQTDERPW